MIKVNEDGPVLAQWLDIHNWLCEHVGKRGVDWNYQILDFKSDQLTFKREANETAFRLRWM